MNGNPALYATLTSATPATEQHPTVLRGSLIFVALTGLFALVAVISNFSLTPDQRTQVFQQSGMYP
jgi:hypothetical protein